MKNEDYIKRSELIEHFRNYNPNWGVIDKDTVLDDIRDFPAADVEPVRHGRWSLYGEGAICSVCQKWVDSDISRDMEDYVVWPYYCPFFGAKMDKEADNGDKL